MSFLEDKFPDTAEPSSATFGSVTTTHTGSGYTTTIGASNSGGTSNSSGPWIGSGSIYPNPMIPNGGPLNDPLTSPYYHNNNITPDSDLKIVPRNHFNKDKDQDLMTVTDKGDPDSLLGLNYSDFEMLAALIDVLNEMDDNDPLKEAINDRVAVHRTTRALKKLGSNGTL